MNSISTTTAASPSPVGTGDRVLVDPAWLQAHLSDPRLRVVEVDVSAAAYNTWHIPGATLWNIYTDLKDTEYRPVGTHALEQLVARSGIDPDSTVVFYGYAPALGVWLLENFGHPDARILDCARDTWRAAGRPCSTTADSPGSGTFQASAANVSIRADHDAVRNAIDQSHTTLLDVRSAAEYRGECFWPSGALEPSGRAGHVPSAVHQPLEGLYREDGSFRTAAELRELFSPAVLGGDAELITYCTVGGRAAAAWFVLTHLIGRDRVRVYDGSWAEWGRITDAPVATGLHHTPAT